MINIINIIMKIYFFVRFQTDIYGNGYKVYFDVTK